MKRLQVSEPLVRTSSCLVSCSRWARLSSDSPAMLVTRSADIVETATGVKILPSGEMSFASITSMAMSSMKRFKATYNHTMGLAREIMEVGAGYKWRVDLVISPYTIQSFRTGEAIHV